MHRKKKAKAASVAAINVTTPAAPVTGSSVHVKKVTLMEEAEIETVAAVEGEPSTTSVAPLTERIDESTIELWKSVFDMEKNRYSFFDQLFAQGHVVDSLEVMSSGQNEPVEHFVEAEPADYENKTAYGRVVFKTKHVYTGGFEDWYFHGPGKYVWADGTVYQGEFRNGLMHGQGSIYWSDGSVYEGEFLNGERAPGWNIYTTAEGFTFAGDWQNGLPHGKGKIWYDPENDNSDYYDGEWSNGLHQGHGIRQYVNGDRYVGNWENGVRSGQGTMIWLEERQVYKGQWAEGKPNGVGKHIWYYERGDTHVFPSRHVYLGDWVDGKREGIGKMIYPCGSTYEGRWKDGQRHGKGVFLNPAGALVTGLFKNGNLVGGSEVPLHSPTYDCDFSGLVEYLTAKFKLDLEAEESEEKNLTLIVERNLTSLRQLYQRAGELAHKWGNNGLYPHWKKEERISRISVGRIPNHSEKSLPPHMHPKTAKPPSPDGVYPVTRFGLWLLLKDCPQLTEDVTLAYFDRHFSNSPSISFQTRHNPFEPVLLWQFLQCLVVVAVALYMEIPEHKRKMKFPRGSHSGRKRQRNDEDDADSKSRLASHEDTSADLRESQHSMKRRQSKSSVNRPSIAKRMSPAAKERKKSVLTVDKGEVKPKHSLRHINSSHRLSPQRHHKGGGGVDEDTEVDSSVVPPEDGFDHETEADEVNVEFEEEHGRDRAHSHSKMKLGISSNKSKTAVVSDSVVHATEADGHHHSQRKSKANKFKGSKFNRSLKAVKGGNESVTKTASEWEGEESSESDESVWTNAPGLSNPKPFKLSISKAFESFLAEKLITCLDVKPGKYLPDVPNPLPPIADLFDAFQNVNDQKEFISAQDFLRSMLPHLQKEEPIYWHRSPEMLSTNINMDEFFQLQKKKFSYSESTTRLTEELGDRDFLGAADDILAVNSAFERRTEEDDGPKEPTMEFLSDPLPFAEQDLPSQPFLWKDDPKCITLKKPTNANENLQTQDIINVLRALYPKLVGKPKDTNVHFDMIFCDWLWATALAARISVDRDDLPEISIEEPVNTNGNQERELEKDENDNHSLLDHSQASNQDNSVDGARDDGKKDEKDAPKKKDKSRKKKDKEKLKDTESRLLNTNT